MHRETSDITTITVLVIFFGKCQNIINGFINIITHNYIVNIGGDYQLSPKINMIHDIHLLEIFYQHNISFRMN